MALQTLFGVQLSSIEGVKGAKDGDNGSILVSNYDDPLVNRHWGVHDGS